MDKLSKWLLGMVICSFGFSAITGCAPITDISFPPKGEWYVYSPDESLQVNVVMNAQGGMEYSVLKDGVDVVSSSELGMLISEDDFDFVSMEDVQSQHIKGSYDNISGKSSHVEYECNETKFILRGWEYYLDIIVRAYDDGYAFRYGIRAIDGGEGTVSVTEEKSTFTVPEQSVFWAQEYISNRPEKGEFFSYETEYLRRSPRNFNGEYLAMPLLYQVGDSKLYSLITESCLIGSGFYGSFLKAETNDEESATLQTVHSPAGGTVDDNTIAYPFQSPWRIGIVGTIGEVVESNLVEKVYDDVEPWKPEEYDTLSSEEQAIYQYDWVEPGVSAWNWLMYDGVKGQNDYNLQREYIDLASSMGWKYTILDGGWSEASSSDIRALTQYAAERGVKVIVWCNALSDFGNGNEQLLKTKLDEYRDLDISGIKIDFFDGQTAINPKHYGEDIATIKWYETIYQETARRQMIVLCHGSNKPTGERRMYPNVLGREAVYGNEFISVGSTATVNSMFTRAVIGPTDFTPVVNPRTENLTKIHQMALAVLYESGIEVMADLRETYEDTKINAFYRAIPSARDETLFLNGEPDVFYCAAVRCGESWFVAGINSILKTDVNLDFSFLGEEEYIAQVFLGSSDDYDEIEILSKEITKDSKETLTMYKNGGFVFWLTPKK